MTLSLVAAAEAEAAFTEAACVPEVSTAAATEVAPWQVARAEVMP
jgi:hypothetical protein